MTPKNEGQYIDHDEDPQPDPSSPSVGAQEWPFVIEGNRYFCPWEINCSDPSHPQFPNTPEGIMNARRRAFSERKRSKSERNAALAPSEPQLKVQHVSKAELDADVKKVMQECEPPLSAQEAVGWIRCSDRLPVPGLEVLIACYTMGGRWTQTAHHNGEQWRCDYRGIAGGVDILYWQKFPQSPAREKREKPWDAMKPEERASLCIEARLTPEVGYHLKWMLWREIPEHLAVILEEHTQKRESRD